MKLEDVCEAIVDCEHKTAPIDLDGEAYAVGTPAMRGNRIDFTQARQISMKTYEAWTRRLTPQSEDLLLAREAPVGPVVRVPGDVLVAPGQRTVLIRPDKAKVDSRYLYYLLASPWGQASLMVKAEGSTVPHLNVADVRTFELPELPTVEEQRAIAATLGALDDKIESNLRAIVLSELLARSLFERLFDLTQFAEGTALSELIDVNPRRVLKAGTPATYVGMSSLPEFSAEVYGWETKEAASGQRFVSGDVLMARITPCLENGKTAVVDMLQDGEVGWGSTEYVVLSPVGQYSTPWIYCLVRDERIREFAIQSMTGTSGRQRFQADRFSQYRIAEPDKQNLSAFNAVAEPLFAQMTQLRDESLRLSAVREALLPQLLSGRLRAGRRSV